MDQLILGLAEMIWGLSLIFVGLCLLTAMPPWVHDWFAIVGWRNWDHAAWYGKEIRPQIEKDGGIGKLAHLALRAELIKRRKRMEDYTGIRLFGGYYPCIGISGADDAWHQLVAQLRAARVGRS